MLSANCRYVIVIGFLLCKVGRRRRKFWHADVQLSDVSVYIEISKCLNDGRECGWHATDRIVAFDSNSIYTSVLFSV
jgi:hypothetical protein